MINLIIITFISYFLGSIPFSYLAAKIYGKNLFEIGSKNIGTVNVWRATGKLEATFLALIGDVGKGALAVLIAQSYAFRGDSLWIFQALAAFFVILGHNWSIFLKFKGGKGLASLAGVILAINWKILPIVLLIIGFFIILIELLMKRKIDLAGSFKEKIKKIFLVFISQIIGRVLGIFAATMYVFLFHPQSFRILIFAILLAGIKHIKRTKNFLEKKNEI